MVVKETENQHLTDAGDPHITGCVQSMKVMLINDIKISVSLIQFKHTIFTFS